MSDKYSQLIDKYQLNKIRIPASHIYSAPKTSYGSYVRQLYTGEYYLFLGDNTPAPSGQIPTIKHKRRDRTSNYVSQ